jgi:tetratricopeptide (TPR) repeat protein
MAIGQEQRVDAVLDGTIQKADNKIRVSVRLIRIADGTTLWAGEFDENYTDIFTLQSAISDRVAEVVITRLSAEEKQALHKRDTDNIEAYNLYLTGRYFWTKFTEEGLDKSIDYFNQALQKDPNYGSAYNGLAASYVVLECNYRPPREVMPKAKAYIEKALEGDAPPADAYMLRGAIKYFFDWDWSGAENDFKRAVELGPSDAASAHQLYAYYLWAVGRLDEGMVEMKRSHELDPASLQINEDLGVAYYYLRDFDQAIQQQHKDYQSGFKLFLWLCASRPGLLAKEYVQRGHRRPDQGANAFRELAGGGCRTWLRVCDGGSREQSASNNQRIESASQTRIYRSIFDRAD